MLRQRRLQSLQGATGLHGHRQVGPGVFDDAVESRRGQDQVRAFRRISPVHLRAAATGNYAYSDVVRQGEHRGQLPLILRLSHKLRKDSAYSIARRGRMQVFAADDGSVVLPGWIQFVAWPSDGILVFPSESFRNSGDLQRMRDVFSRFFAAQSRRGENLRGIGKQQRVERAAHALHRVEIRFAEHLRHHALFLFAHAVLAGDRASRRETQFQDLVRRVPRRPVPGRQSAGRRAPADARLPSPA